MSCDNSIPVELIVAPKLNNQVVEWYHGCSVRISVCDSLIHTLIIVHELDWIFFLPSTLASVCPDLVILSLKQVE